MRIVQQANGGTGAARNAGVRAASGKYVALLDSESASYTKPAFEFSVIVPTYNRLNLLTKAIESIRNQTYDGYEIIVVDDGSTDGTPDYLATAGNEVKWLRQENKGPAAARNLGAAKATGAYLAFLDSDDVWLPWVLATLHEVILQHKEPSLICVRTMEFEGSMPDIPRNEFMTESSRDFLETACSPSFVGSGALVVKRSVFERIGGFDERITVGEDLDFFLRAGLESGFVRIVSPIMLAYRRHMTNVSTSPLALYFGAVQSLQKEFQGQYPGGQARRAQRWNILTRMARPIALSCLEYGLHGEAWRLYSQTFIMNLKLLRLRFLGGFLLLGFYYWFCRGFRTRMVRLLRWNASRLP
jgi:glycosyltransferase involved in cell wall biosynthesis